MYKRAQFEELFSRILEPRDKIQVISGPSRIDLVLCGSLSLYSIGRMPLPITPQKLSLCALRVLCGSA